MLDDMVPTDPAGRGDRHETEDRIASGLRESAAETLALIGEIERARVRGRPGGLRPLTLRGRALLPSRARRQR